MFLLRTVLTPEKQSSTDLNYVDADKHFDWLIARQTLEKAVAWIPPGDGTVLDVRGQRNFVYAHGALR